MSYIGIKAIRWWRKWRERWRVLRWGYNTARFLYQTRAWMLYYPDNREIVWRAAQDPPDMPDRRDATYAEPVR